MHLHRAIVVGLSVLVSALAWAAAQQGSAQNEEPAAAIRVDVSVVNLLVSVRDGKGALVSTLNKDDFEVREDGKPQQILYFTRESTLPLTIGLLVDSSVSQQRLIAQEREAAREFFQQVMRRGDAAFLISFDVHVDLLQDVTGSVPMLQRSLEQIRTQGSGAVVQNPGPFPGSVTRGGTLLYDAVYLASEEVLEREAGRKAIILITDGQDQGSRVSRDHAIESAQRSDVILYAIQFLDRDFYGSRGYAGDGALKRMAEETGGRVFRATNDRQLEMAFAQISEELRSQYSIGYSPANAARDGSYRRVDVRARGKGLRVQSRRGYYAPAADPAR